MMNKDSTTILVIGLAATGLALAAGAWFVSRRMGKVSALPSGEGMGVLDEAGDEGEVLREGVQGAPESGGNVQPEAVQGKLPWDYFALVFALTVPFYLFGGNPLPIPVKLPASALMLVNPLLAALILTYRRDGFAGARDLLKRAFDYRKIKRKAWYLPVLFLNPLIAVVAYGAMRLAGMPLPDPQIPWLAAPVIFLVFFVAAIFEELGWMGYAFDPLQDRWGALKGSLVLGLVWALIHLIPDLQNEQTLSWILWHRLGTVAARVLMAWIYNNTGGSVFAVILFHAANNLGWTLFSNYGSHYDPFAIFMMTLPFLGFVLMVWEPKTLSRYRQIGFGRSATQNPAHL